jgi:hypothetical protein
MIEEIVMLRALELSQYVGAGYARRLAAVGLLAVGGAVAPLVLRARRKAQAKQSAAVEVGRLEVRGERYGAVYEDGRLVGVLEGVDRL